MTSPEDVERMIDAKFDKFVGFLGSAPIVAADIKARWVRYRRDRSSTEPQQRLAKDLEVLFRSNMYDQAEKWISEFYEVRKK